MSNSLKSETQEFDFGNGTESETTDPASVEPSSSHAPSKKRTVRARGTWTEPPPAIASRPAPEIVAPKFKYGYDQPVNSRPGDFFSWWGSLSSDLQHRLICYVYRVWPVGGELRQHPKTHKTSFTTQIAKVAGEDPIKDLEEFKRRYGSGDYNLILNEQVHQRKTITRCAIRIREMEEYPPCIPDIKWLDLTDPANTSYIESLRLKGVEIPGDKSRGREQEERDDMAVTEAVTELAGTVKDLTRQAVAAAQHRPEAPAPSMDSQAQLKAIDLVQQAGTTACEIVKTAAQQMGQMQQRSSSPATDLAAVAGVLKDLASALRPEKADNPIDSVLKLLNTAAEKEDNLHKQIMNLQQVQIAQLQAAVDRMLSERQTAAAVANPPMTAQIKEMAEMKKLLRDFLDMGEEDEDKPSRGSRSGGLLEAAVNNAPGILTAIGGIVSGIAAAAHNAAVARTGQGTPIPVPPPAPIPQPGELAPGSMETTTAQGVSPEVQMQIHQQVQALTGPLVKALNEDKTGDEFAEILIEYAGRNTYDQLSALGKNGILMLLQVYAREVYALVMSMPARFDGFLDEFLDYDALNEQEEEAKRRAGKKIKAVKAKPVVGSKPEAGAQEPQPAA